MLDEDEFNRVVFNLNPDRAHEPDGFVGAFFSWLLEYY